MKKNKKGFTLIELLAVIVVLGIILAIAIPRITNTIKTSKEAAFKNSVKMIMNVARDYAIKNQLENGKTYPIEPPEGKENNWLEFKGKEKYSGEWKWENNKVTILSLITDSNSVFDVDNNNINMANVDPLYEFEKKDGTVYNVTISGTTISSKISTTGGYTGVSKNIKLPSGIRFIGDYSFYKSGLSNVIIPDYVTSIGLSAFSNNKLTTVTIPNSVTYLGTYAFSSNQLTSVTIPNFITSIGIGAFYTNKLTSITIPDFVSSINDVAFRYNELTNIAIPSSVTSIGGGAFANNKLTSITIPNSITSIGTNVFGTNLLTSVTIPSSVTSIGTQAFSANQIINIVIPNSVTSIGNEAFKYNPLTTIKNEPGRNFNWKSIIGASSCTMATGESNDAFITGSCNYSYNLSSNVTRYTGSGTVNITN